MSENEKHNEKMKEAEDVEAKNFRKKNGKKRPNNCSYWNRQRKEYCCLWHGF